jgi:DNA-binding transcriptional LysR family regulator
LYAASNLPHDPQAASRLPLIGFDKESEAVAEAEWLEQHFSNRRVSFRVNSQIGQAAAARAGFGIALLPRYLIAEDPGLTEIAAEVPILERELWLLVRPDLVKVPRVRAVADYLVELFAQERQRFAGKSNHRERDYIDRPSHTEQQPDQGARSDAQPLSRDGL